LARVGAASNWMKPAALSRKRHDTHYHWQPPQIKGGEMSTLQQQLEAGTSRCANTECEKITHYLLVDPVDEPGMVFCSWACLWRYINKKDYKEFYRGDCNDALYTAVNQKAKFCHYQPDKFCQEGDCTGCNIYQEVQR